MGCQSSTQSNQRETIPPAEFTLNSGRFQAIQDRYETIEEVQQALRKSGLESSNLVVAVDFTKSNTWTGLNSFGGKCLHSLRRGELNPYESAMSTIGRTLGVFDDDQLIPCLGFGDHSSKKMGYFPFMGDGSPCNGLEECLELYRHHANTVQLSGPTNFGPVIRETIRIVREEDNGYHILVIIADGQVTMLDDTVSAIVEATEYPISIVLVGVGDGPWDTMEDFDDNLPARKFDNFQFVNYTDIMQRNLAHPDVEFSVAALMEVPDQYNIIRKAGLIGRDYGRKSVKKGSYDAGHTTQRVSGRKGSRRSSAATRANRLSQDTISSSSSESVVEHLAPQ